MANYSQGYFLVNYGVELSIDTTPQGTSRTWAVLGDGITNVSEALNEVKQQMYYLINRGWGQTEVTAMHPTFTVTGHRLKGDAAQDFIFGKKYSMGTNRKTQMKVKVFNAEDRSTIFDEYLCSVTFCDLQEYSGSTENGSDISITLELNGSPEQICNAPTFTVTGDGTASVQIVMATTTTGASIHYTSDGTEPTASSPAYSTTITDTVAGTKTYKAIAVKEGFANSEVSSKTVTVSA